MRIRTLLAFGAGAALGAGTVYLGDPDHGRQRRREARSWAAAQGRARATAAAGTAVRSARSYAQAAVEGYREASTTPR